MPAGEPAPKRGDLVHTNLGNRRERTWMILQAHKRARCPVPARTRYDVFMGNYIHDYPKELNGKK